MKKQTKELLLHTVYELTVSGVCAVCGVFSLGVFAKHHRKAPLKGYAKQSSGRVIYLK